MIKKVAPLCIGVFCLLASSLLAFGAEIITINEPKVKLGIAPGGEESGIIQVTNPSPVAKKVRLYLEDWSYLSPFDGSKEFRPAGSLPLSACPWISFIPKEFTVPAYGRMPVSYKVTVPKEAEGGHYGVLFFEMFLEEPQAEKAGVTVGVAVRIASLFYVEAKGTVLRQGQLENLKLNKRANQLTVSADFDNTGNVDITSKGTFYVIDKKGLVYARGAFNDVYTLPGDKAALVARANSQIKPGIYDLVITLQFQDGSVKTTEETIRVSEWNNIELISEK